MEQQKRNGDRAFKVITVVALVVAVLCLSVAYAALSQQLKITGTAKVEHAEWKVDNDGTAPSVNRVGEGTVEEDPTATTVGGVTTVSFKAKLKKPGDAVEISVPVKNTGDIDAVLASVSGANGVLTCTGTTADKQIICGTDDKNTGANVKYTVYYNDTPVTSINDITSKDLVKETGTATVKVRVEYLNLETPQTLPSAEVTVTVPEVTFVYQQKIANS